MLGPSLNERDATTGDDALFNGRLGVADGILNAMLALLELNLSCCADLDHRDAASQLGQPLLQLLAVVVGVRLIDLIANLVDPTLDLLGISGALDDGRLILGDDHLTSLSKQFQADAVELEPNFLADYLTGSMRKMVGVLQPKILVKKMGILQEKYMKNVLKVGTRL